MEGDGLAQMGGIGDRAPHRSGRLSFQSIIDRLVILFKTGPVGDESHSQAPDVVFLGRAVHFDGDKPRIPFQKPAKDGFSERVVVIEDNENAARLMSRILEGRKNSEVYLAHNGAAGLRLRSPRLTFVIE